MLRGSSTMRRPRAKWSSANGAPEFKTRPDHEPSSSLARARVTRGRGRLSDGSQRADTRARVTKAPGTLSEIDGARVKGAPRRFSVEVPGATLCGLVLGDARERTLVALHGGPGEAHDVLRPHL